MTRTHGRCARGKRLVAKVPHGHWRTLTFLAALRYDRIDWLTRETGMSRDQLLSGLSTALPQAVDKLTPNGRVASEQEAEGLLTSG